MTLLDRMLQPGPGSVIILGRPGQVCTTDRDTLVQEASRLGSGLAAEGIEPGDVVGVIVRPDLDAISALVATWTVGATVLVLPARSALEDRAAWAQRTSDALARAGAHLVIVPPGEPRPQPLPARTVNDLRRDDVGPLRRPVANDTALIRLSSGTSGPVKLAPRSHAALRSQLERDEAADEGLDPSRDRRLGWGPLHTHHLLNDVLYPLAAGVDTVMLPTRRFTEDPLRWLVELSHHRATYSAAASFAYDLVASRIEAGAGDGFELDLSAWRLAHCGGEAIAPATFERFAAATARWGFDPRSLRAVYGSSEFGRLAAAPTNQRWCTDRVDAAALATGSADPAAADDPHAVPLLSVGHPPVDVELRVLTDDDDVATERTVGEIAVRRPAMAAGYVGDEDASQRRFRDGWFHTGDLGYLAGGELYVIGRADDTIIVRGRNLQPTAIEHELAVALGDTIDTVALVPYRHHASTGLSVILEATETPADLRAIIDPLLSQLAGITATDISVLAPGALPRNASGKLDRKRLHMLHRGA